MEFIYENNRIYLNNEGNVVAEITFPLTTPTSVDINHTFVDPSLRGRGIAESLVRAAADDIRARNLKTTTTCSFAAKWFKSHPEYLDLLDHG
jgi:Predicted acetyltransferase